MLMDCLFAQLRRPSAASAKTISLINFLRTIVSALTLVLVLTNGSAYADARQSAWQAISAEEVQSNAAYIRGDIVGFVQFMTPDYSLYSGHGPGSNRSQVYHNCLRLRARQPNLQRTQAIQSFDLIKSVEALVVWKYHMSWILTSSDGLRHSTLDAYWTESDDWVWTTRGWRERQSSWQNFQTFTNGKLYR